MENRRSSILHEALADLDTPSRQNEEEAEDSLQFLWAVSYSDLLMVLMSFFIVYFSFTTPEGKSLMDEISVSFKSGGTHSVIEENQKPISRERDQTARPMNAPMVSMAHVEGEKVTPVTSPLLKEIQSRLKGANEAEKDLSGVTALRVDLEDNAFSLGGYDLSVRTKQEIQDLLKLISPYKDRITLSFIGHADQAPVRPRNKKSALQTNMNLSSLRAGSGVTFAISEGFDPRAIWAEGFAEYGRNTRSLSIRIKEKVKP